MDRQLGSWRKFLRLWIAGARPRTLGAAVVPVTVAAAVIVNVEDLKSIKTIEDFDGSLWLRFALSLVVAVALQVGVNYANDFSDGVRGTDRTGSRVGPVRLVGSGSIPPTYVRNAAFLFFGVAGCAGLVLAAVAGWWLLLVGVVCVLAALGYTGGPWPYGYAGLGEVFVFVFFGLVATVGTAYVLVERFELLALAVAVPVGLWAVALLVVNNLRDIESDRIAGKRTLAVRLGRPATRFSYMFLLAMSYVLVAVVVLLGHATWVALAGAPFAVHAMFALHRADGPEALIKVLTATARVQFVSGLGFAAGLALTG